MSAGQQLVATMAGTWGGLEYLHSRAPAGPADVAADDIDTAQQRVPSSSRKPTPCLYFHSNHILRSAFQDFSRHDAPMHRCSRAPELTSSATDRATHHQSVTDSTARQSSSHQLLLRKVQRGTPRRGTVLQHAAWPASPVDGTNALPPPRIVSSYRPTPGHLQPHMLRGTAHPSPFGPLPTYRAGIHSRLPGSQSP